MAVSCNRNNCVIPVEQQQTTNDTGGNGLELMHAILCCGSTNTLPTPTEMVEKLVRIHARNVRSLAMIRHSMLKSFLYVAALLL